MAGQYEETTQEVILDFEQNTRGECIRVSKLTGKNSGTVKIDIRRYYTDKEGNLAPTSKGIRFDIESIAEFAGAIQKLVSSTDENVGD